MKFRVGDIVTLREDFEKVAKDLNSVGYSRLAVKYFIEQLLGKELVITDYQTAGSSTVYCVGGFAIIEPCLELLTNED